MGLRRAIVESLDFVVVFLGVRRGQIGGLEVFEFELFDEVDKGWLFDEVFVELYWS